MAAMANRNSEALATAVEKITATLISREGHTSPEVPSPSPSAHNFLVADKGAASPPAWAHTSQLASVDFWHAAPLRLRKRRGAHTDLLVATIVASGHSGCYSSPIASAEKSGYLPPDDDASLVASDTELALDHSPHKGHVPTSDPSTVASSLYQLKKLYDLEEKVGLPLGDFMADSLNVMGRQHLEKSSLEDMLGRQLRPANIDLQLKQVNEEIYSRQGGQMSNARGKDGSLKRINNVLQKAMIPLMRVADNLYLADTTEAEAPSMMVLFLKLSIIRTSLSLVFSLLKSWITPFA